MCLDKLANPLFQKPRWQPRVSELIGPGLVLAGSKSVKSLVCSCSRAVRCSENCSFPGVTRNTPNCYTALVLPPHGGGLPDRKQDPSHHIYFTSQNSVKTGHRTKPVLKISTIIPENINSQITAVPPLSPLLPSACGRGSSPSARCTHPGSACGSCWPSWRAARRPSPAAAA